MRISEIEVRSLHEDDLPAWEKLFIDLQASLNKNNDRYLSKKEIFEACVVLVSDHPEYENPGLIYDLEPNFDVFYNELKDYPFELNRVQLITSSEGITIPLLQTKVGIKVKGIIWRLHKSDADPFPSNPHAHNIDNGLKLHLGNGEIYRKKNIVDQLPKKTLLEIRGKYAERGIEMPPLTR